MTFEDDEITLLPKGGFRDVTRGGEHGAEIGNKHHNKNNMETNHDADDFAHISSDRMRIRRMIGGEKIVALDLRVHIDGNKSTIDERDNNKHKPRVHPAGTSTLLVTHAAVLTL